MLISTRCLYNLLAHAFSQLCKCGQAQMQRLRFCLLSHSLPLFIAQCGCTLGLQRPLIHVLGGAALNTCAHAVRSFPCSHAYGRGTGALSEHCLATQHLLLFGQTGASFKAYPVHACTG